MTIHWKALEDYFLMVPLVFRFNFVPKNPSLTLSVLGHMAAIVLRPLSGNFTGPETHAVKNSEEVYHTFFTCIA
jgi:hypothetical protein